MIKVSDIKKSFSYNNVLKGVSFEVKQGTIYGLIGRNGAGKTTLMNIMSGLMEPDAGSCSFGGGEKAKVGYLPDLPEFYDYLTTDEYLDFLLMNEKPNKRNDPQIKRNDSQIKRNELQIRRNELLKMVSLPPKVKVKTLSRGMRQRLGIAAVLVNDPDVILLDEPTSALDPAGRNDVKNILLSLKEKGKTIILSTHILADMDSICDKAGFLNNGVIVKEVEIAKSREDTSEFVVSFRSEPDMEELYKFAPVMYVIDPLTIRIVIDKENRLSSQQSILQGLSQQKMEITSIKSGAVSLDDIFQEVCAT